MLRPNKECQIREAYITGGVAVDQDIKVRLRPLSLDFLRLNTIDLAATILCFEFGA